MNRITRAANVLLKGVRASKGHSELLDLRVWRHPSGTYFIGTLDADGHPSQAPDNPKCDGPLRAAAQFTELLHQWEKLAPLKPSKPIATHEQIEATRAVLID
jgi:hypothetical protein